MANDGFFSLGEMLAGGGIDREGARLEGLDIGSRIQARRATTVNALAQARLRVQEHDAKMGLVDMLEAVDLPPELAVQLRAGGTIKDVMGGLLQQQEFGNRENLADLAVSPEQRLQSAQAIEVPKNPFQFGPSGTLAADVFNPGGAPFVTEVGTAAIDFDVARAEDARANASESPSVIRANEARALASTAAANLSDKRAGHLKASALPLSEQILPSGQGGISIIPDDNFVAEEGFGAESFIKGAANAFTDFIGAGVHFPDQVRAQTVLRELASATKIVMRLDVAGGRIPIMVQEQLNVYAENPQELFRGDEIARENLRSTLAHLQRAVRRIRNRLDSPADKTPTVQGKLEAGLFKLTDLIADYEKVLQSIQNTEGDSVFGDNQAAPDAAGVTQVPGGGSFTISDDG